MAHLRDQAGLELTAPDGSTTPLEKLWQRRPIVLAVIRHFG